MRVALTTYGFPTYHHSFVESHVLAVAERGLDVDVVYAATGDHELRRPVSGGSIELTGAPFSASRAEKVWRLGAALWSARRNNPHELASLLGTLRHRGRRGDLAGGLYSMTPVLSGPADVVHVAWLAQAARWNELLGALRRPLVVTCNGADLSVDPFVDPDHAARIREVFSRVDVAHCVSTETAQLAVEFGLDPAKLLVASWGTDPRFFSPRSSSSSSQDRMRTPSTLRVVSVGRVHWVKAYDYALHALQEVARAGIDVSYSIFGEEDPKIRQAVLTTVRDLGLEGRVHLNGSGTREQVRDALRSADVFLLTSVREGLCTASLEAMAVEVPVVVTDVGGARDAVDDGVEGFVVASRDVGAIAKAVLDLANDPELRHRMGRRGRERVIAEFDARDQSAKLVDAYQRLAASR